jgi:hypothetical protein
MRFFATVILFVCAVGSQASAAITGFEYAGEIIQLATDRYNGGLSSYPPTPVVGRVLYDNATLASDAPSCHAGTCLGYRQHIVDGMAAKFGDLIITADDYVVEVQNDNENNGVFDSLRFIARPDAYSPRLPSQLKVNGLPRDNAWYQLVLNGSQDVFADTSLPPAVDFSQFTPAATFGVFDGDPSGVIDVLFRLTSLSPLAFPGDYNRDHDVTADDYDVWQSSFGDITVLGADGSGSHVVDAADYVVWRARQSAGLPLAIPEPSAVSALTTLVVLWIAACKRQRGSGGVV